MCGLLLTSHFNATMSKFIPTVVAVVTIAPPGVFLWGGGAQIGTADVFVCMDTSNKMPQTVGFKN